MASQATPRHEAIVERLQQLLDAIRIMQKMVGNEEQTWVAESAEAVANFEPTAANTAYVNAVKYLYDVTTRFTLIFKDATTPEQVGTYAETMERALVGLVQTSQALLKVSKAHELLVQQTNILVLDTLELVCKLTAAMMATVNAPDATRLTGQIWANCDALEKVDVTLSVKQYVMAAAKAALAGLKDALAELQEEQANEDEDELEEDLETASGDQEDMDLLMAGFSLKQNDKKILPGCILLLKTAYSFCNQLYKITELTDDKKNDTNTTVVLLDAYRKSLKVSEAVDNVNSSIYPPQKVDEVLSNAATLQQLLESIANLFLTLPELAIHHTKISTLITTAKGVFSKAEEQIRNP